MPKCSSCEAGEIYDVDATVLVEFPNPNHPNLKIRQWLCDDHHEMIACDCAEGEVKVIKEVKE